MNVSPLPRHTRVWGWPQAERVLLLSEEAHLPVAPLGTVAAPGAVNPLQGIDPGEASGVRWPGGSLPHSSQLVAAFLHLRPQMKIGGQEVKKKTQWMKERSKSRE